MATTVTFWRQLLLAPASALRCPMGSDQAVTPETDSILKAVRGRIRDSHKSFCKAHFGLALSTPGAARMSGICGAARADCYRLKPYPGRWSASRWPDRIDIRSAGILISASSTMRFSASEIYNLADLRQHEAVVQHALRWASCKPSAACLVIRMLLVQTISKQMLVLASRRRQAC